MPVRQLDLDFREGLRRLSLSAICPAPSRHLRAERKALGTPEAGARSMMEVRNYRGVDPDGVAQTEADHFMKCPGCGEWFDKRDLGQVLAHVHDAKIEIVEVPMPPREKPLQ